MPVSKTTHSPAKKRPMSSSDAAAGESVSLLKAMPLFKTVPESDLQALAGMTQVVRFTAGTTILHDGDDGRAVYFLCSGEVKSSLKNAANARIPLGDITHGFFGEVALLHDGTRSATVEAVRDTVALRVEHEDFLRLLPRHPNIMLAMMGEMASRLARASQDLRMTSVRNPNEIVESITSSADRRIHRAARFCGSLAFLIWCALVCLLWIAVTVLLGDRYFDRSVGLLSLVVSVTAIVVTCIVLHSQNRQADNDRARNEEETRANLRAEVEIRTLHEKLRQLHADLSRLRSAPDPATNTLPHGNASAE